MTTLAKINKNLKKLNIDAEILSGKGYVYFAGPATDLWKETIVPGMLNVKELTNEQGYALFQEMCELNSFGSR
jgi:hypothetical protein